MTIISKGNSVKVHYKGTLDDGTVFDSSRKRNQTLDFEVGSGTLLEGFEQAVLGMTTGDTKTFRLTSEEAYGQRTEDAIRTIPKTAFPTNMNFVVGQRVGGTNELGQQIFAVIQSVNESEVTLDHNHPLAGKDINFEIEIVEVT